jgi:hypothetical protein
MKILSRIALASLGFAATFAFAADNGQAAGRRIARPEKPDWEFAATGYWNEVRDGDSYANGIFVADRGALHLEGRVNYEAQHSRSLVAGWTFSLGKEEGLNLEITPILGGAWGDVKGPIAGVEATLARGRFDFYVEAEYVRGTGSKADSYTYAWSELGFRPERMQWLRLGAVGQRTRAYGGSREYQGGGFVQLSHGPVTAGLFWFNPGSDSQVVVGSIGLAF